MKTAVKQLDDFLNKFTMYRTLAYGLSTLAAIGLFMSLINELSIKPLALIFSYVIVVAVSYITNIAIATFWNVPTNTESWYITALILFFILPPASTTERALYIGLAALIAIASKFVLAINGKHIFNPAAFGAFAIGIFGLMHTSWWIGSSSLWVFALLYGLTVIRKIRKFQLLLSFVITALTVSFVMAASNGTQYADLLKFIVTTSPLIFLGTIMLTEPSTMPSRHTHQLFFGALVGGLYAWHPTVGTVFIYPETALLIGNVYAFFRSTQRRMILRLKEVNSVSDTVKDYVFEVKNKPPYLAGQYTEWTLGHSKVDGRGNRRSFTIASSPTESEIHLGVKFYERSSSFKSALKTMKPGDKLYGGTISGDFILPTDQSQKITMIAGGIGITPFRSMLKFLIDTKQKRNIVLYYLVSDAKDVAYKDIFEKALSYGVKVIYICPHKTAGFETEFNQTLLKRTAPDFTERATYISGPNAMVTNYQQLLHSLGVKRSNIKTDHFSGY